MSDKITINVGGEQIDLPKWATEKTLAEILSKSKTSNILIDGMATYLKQGHLDIQEVVDNLENITTSYAQSNDAVDKAKKVSLDKHLVSAAKATKSTVDKFSNTDTPLSSMVEMLGDFGGALTGAGQGAANRAKANSKVAAGLSKFVPVLGAAGSAGMAWLGFQAGQLEQFAKAQATMIDAGAIMFENTSPYETLKQSVINSGLTYTEMTKIVSTNGIAMQSLGNGVSKGTTVFTSMFDSVNKTGDQFGDYGLQSVDMANLFAEYINTQRMSLGKDMALVSTQNDVKLGFHELLIETTALASLTGQNRSELLQKRMAVYSDPQVASALSKMRENGDGNYADIMKTILDDMLLLEAPMGQVGKDISDALQSYMFVASANPKDFDLVQGIGKDLSAAMNNLSEGSVERINAAVRSGDPQKAIGLMFSIIQDFAKGEVGPASAAGDAVIGISKMLAEGSYNASLFIAELSKKSATEIDAYKAKTADDLATSGGLTVTMNNLKESFNQVQHAFTTNVDSASEMAEKLAGALKEGADTIQELLGVNPQDKSLGVLVSNVVDDFSWKNVKKLAVHQPFSDEHDGTQKARIIGKDETYESTTTGQKIGDAIDSASLETVAKATVATTVAAAANLAEVAVDSASMLTDMLLWTGKQVGGGVAGLIDMMGMMPGPDTLNFSNIGSVRPREEEDIPDAREFGGSVTKDKPYLVGERGPELFTPTSHGNITNNNKTKMMMDSPNSDDKKKSQELDEIIAMKKQTVAVLKQMKAAMKSINRSKDYKRAVDNLA
jgi:hypothetical protein